MRILWLFGPPGVGKSVTAWELLSVPSRHDQITAYVDIDQLGMAAPDCDDEAETHRQKAWALAAVGRVHAERGTTTLLVSGVLDPDQLSFYRGALADFELSLVRLTADEVELRRRMDGRGEYAEDWSGVLADARRHEAAEHGLPVVRTDDGDPWHVARRVLEVATVLPVASSGRTEEPILASGVGAGRAVLVTGTRAVGKSTLGWLAFMAARERGIPTAFVDLRQLGFTGPDGGPTDHELQAAATGALWRVFRARGNDLLLLNGTTDDPAQIALYADRLGATPLTTVRLTASRSDLEARVIARSRGEMALLAGDDITGAGDQLRQRVVDDAHRSQESRPVSADEAVVDTTGLSAPDAARAVLAVIGL